MSRRYILALTLIAILSFAAFASQRLVIHAQERNSTVINVSGRQRYLSQRVAFLAQRMTLATEFDERAEARATLSGTLDLMERSHRALIDGDLDLDLPPERDAELRAMYFEPPLELDAAVGSFLLHASSMAAASDAELTESNTDLQLVLDAASGPLPHALGQAVDRYEAHARTEIERLKLLEAIVLTITLVTLTLEASLIFRPLAVRLRRDGERLIRSQADLERIAHHDALTGLPNRALFQLRLDMALAQARRDRTSTAVLQLDLDHFKDVNDTLGHAAGDQLLREIALRLRRLLRDTDTVARIGGDEFAIILTGLGADHQVGVVARKIVHSLSAPIAYQGYELHTGASIGITLHPSDGSDPAQLLKNADIALYQAKAEGRNTYAFFVGAMKTRVEHRARLENELRRALGIGQVEVLYQPQLQIADGAIAAVEALVRWRHPVRGLLGPEAFLTVAEETGLIVPLGRMVLERAIQQMQLWRQAGIAPARLAINVSAAQLRTDHFAREIEQLLDSCALEPRMLELELREGVLLDRGAERIGHVLAWLQSKGTSIVVDDFGTGPASLTLLKRLKVDRLKIDEVFIRDLESDAEAAAIVSSLLSLGHSLGLELIAEGVETEGQIAFLRDQGCDLAQGFLLGPPMPAAALTDRLTQLAPTPARRRHAPAALTEG